MTLLPPRIHRASRLLRRGVAQLPEQRENPWRVIGPIGHAATPTPIVELHYDPLPAYLYGAYLQDVGK